MVTKCGNGAGVRGEEWTQTQGKKESSDTRDGGAVPAEVGPSLPIFVFGLSEENPAGERAAPHIRGEQGREAISGPGREGRLRQQGQPEGSAAAAASEGARLCPTALAGPGSHGGVVLPPARLQIAVAAGPGEGERGAVRREGGRGSLPLARLQGSHGAVGALERGGDKRGGWGWLPERGARLKSFTAPGHKTS